MVCTEAVRQFSLRHEVAYEICTKLVHDDQRTMVSLPCNGGRQISSIRRLIAET